MHTALVERVDSEHTHMQEKCHKELRCAPAEQPLTQCDFCSCGLCEESRLPRLTHFSLVILN